MTEKEIDERVGKKEKIEASARGKKKKKKKKKKKHQRCSPPKKKKKTHLHLSLSLSSSLPPSLSKKKQQRPSHRAAASPTEASPVASSSSAVPASPAAAADEFYEVFLEKPLGIRFARGRDGEAYVARSDPALGNTDPNVLPGDKLVRVSASFGADVWDAKNFGQVMYAIKTRNGQVYLQLQRKYGDMSALEDEVLTAAERAFRAERGGGNYGKGTKEVQAANYARAKELQKERVALFDAALAKFNKKDAEGALIDFETVLAMEPPKYLGDDFARVTPVYKATQYNVACCYAALGQVEPGMEAIEACMAAGFEDYAKIRSDPNLAALREGGNAKAFKKMMDKYDEPIINEGTKKVGEEEKKGEEEVYSSFRFGARRRGKHQLLENSSFSFPSSPTLVLSLKNHSSQSQLPSRP